MQSLYNFAQIDLARVPVNHLCFGKNNDYYFIEFRLHIQNHDHIL